MNIAIWGAGLSGLSALKYLSSLFERESLFVIQGENPKEWKNLDQVLAFIPFENCIKEEDLCSLNIELEQVILSPGVPRSKPELDFFIKKGVSVISEIELAYRNIQLPIIAVTGSNGKTTTVTMISEAFKSAGYRVFTGGNIGLPFCEIHNLKQNFDFAILELSSFQLESLDTFHAQVAIHLNISENHMERYSSIDEYEIAKLNIFKNQEPQDLAIVYKGFNRVELLAKKVEIEAYIDLNSNDSQIYGEHNFKNLFCVWECLRFFQIPNAKDLMKKLAMNFKGVKFRQEKLGFINEALFINDAKSTNTAATAVAIRAFEEKFNLHLILGGKLRSDKQNLKSELSGYKIKKIYAFGEARDLIALELKDIYEVEKFETLTDVWKKLNAGKLDVVLFSPAFPSFDLYENYVKRGEHFELLFNESLKQ